LETRLTLTPLGHCHHPIPHTIIKKFHEDPQLTTKTKIKTKALKCILQRKVALDFTTFTVIPPTNRTKMKMKSDYKIQIISSTNEQIITPNPLQQPHTKQKAREKPNNPQED